MKTTEWNQSLDHLDSDLIEAYITQKDRLVPRKAHSGKFLRFGMIAAALVLLLGMMLLLPMLRADDPSVSPSPDILKECGCTCSRYCRWIRLWG